MDIGVPHFSSPVTGEPLTTYYLLKHLLLCVSTLFGKFWGRTMRVEYQSHLVLLALIRNGKSASRRRSLLMA